MLLPRELATRYEAVPVRFLADDRRLAVAEPGDLERSLKKLYRTQIEVVEAADEALS
jgi:hypothetical protein